MNQTGQDGVETHARATKLPHRLGELIHTLLFLTHRGLSRADFLRQAAEVLFDFSGCDIVEIRVAEGGRSQRCLAWMTENGQICCDCRFLVPGAPDDPPAGSISSALPETIIDDVLHGRFSPAAPFLTRAGSFWTGDAARPILLREKGGTPADSHTVVIGGDYQSLALIPFPVDDRTRAVLKLSSRRIDFFTRNDIQFHEAVAETLGVALAHQAAQWALGERVKELTCFYQIGKATQDIGRSVEDLLGEVVELLPAGWQYPEHTCARIIFDGRTYATAAFQEYPWRQSSDIVVSGERRGRVEVAYTMEKALADEGPFLREERNLINGVAETLGITLAYQKAQSALRERIKELTCLHAITAVAQRPDVSHSSLLLQIAALLPPAFQYPEITQARLTVDGKEYATPRCAEYVSRIGSDIFVGGRCVGKVEVMYTAVRPESDEGPYLKEERSLINEVARQVGFILERRAVMIDGDIIDFPDLPSLMRFTAQRKVNLRRTLEEVETEYVKNVLASVDGNKSRAAAILGIDRKTLRKRLKESSATPE
jgi:GAF domain-containing protein